MQAIYDVPAPAKLNLFLHVVGKRADGYHLLQSLFVLIDWADTLHFECRSDGALRRHDRGDTLPADDLCLRAARALQQASGCDRGVDIHIEKRLPSGAGMGGGSSDAASTLLALNRLWGLNWTRRQLQALALPLGADVPFFVGGQNAWVEGIGERLYPLSLPELDFAVVKPQASIATKDIFGSPLLQRSESVAIVAGFPAVTDSQQCEPGQIPDGHTLQTRKTHQDFVRQLCEGWGRNDLQPPAEAANSEVSEALTYLQARFGNSRMTGSGSAVFARLIETSQKHAMMTGSVGQLGSNSKATTLEALPSGWVGRQCRSLLAHPLREWAED
jgi:4-diphosphocytidyl-2-C-methyl-D-erythritol kinase